MWVLQGLIAAVFLGLYDVFKKTSVNNNGVLPVLFFTVLFNAVICLPFLIGSRIDPDYFRQIHFYIPEITAREHAQIFLKSAIVVSSWILSFFAIKHLPLTIVAPIRATGPLWTLLGAIIIFHEQLNTLQWIGIVTTLLFFYFFSTAGKLEGIVFRSNKWFYFLILGTLLSVSSGLYDKYIIRAVDRLSVQVWFSLYQVPIMSLVMLTTWLPKRRKFPAFQWRWSIPLISVALILSDYLYFYAVSRPESLISILSALRRGGVLIAFAFGAFLFKEKNIKTKALYLIGILSGIVMIALGSV